MLITSLTVTLLGMGTVFLFLLLLVAAMDATRALLPLLNRISPETAEPAAKAQAPRQAAGGHAAVAAAIAAAYAGSGRTL